MEDVISELLSSLSENIMTKKQKEFAEHFKFIIEDVEKYADGKPSEVQFFVNHHRMTLDNGNAILYKELSKINTGDLTKAEYYCYHGILNGRLWESLDEQCDDYTDLTRKYFKAVYKHLTEGKVVENLYSEWTVDQAKEHYEEHKQFIRVPLEKFLEVYVGKPYFSIKGWNTSEDIINWYYNTVIITKKMLKMSVPELMEAVGTEEEE